MACAQTGSLLDHFSALRDPRQGGKVLYLLPEILLLMLCATLAGANDFVAVRLWGEQALPFLRRLLPYEDGLPSHDTLGDVMNALDPELFKECFLGWVETLRSSPSEADGPEIIAVDGKTSRRTHNRAKGREALHLVSAWACGQRLVLGQEATADKSNEITAIPRLLERLALEGALVTIDAMGTQTEIARTIRRKGGDYLLGLKENWPPPMPRSRRPSPIPRPPWSAPRPSIPITAASRCAATRSATMSTSCTRIAAIRASSPCRTWPWAWSRATPSAPARSSRSGVTISARPSSMPRPSPGPCARIGMSRTGSIGSWMSCSRTTWPACAAATAPKTWRSSSTWLPTCSRRRARPPASRTAGISQAGASTTSTRFFAKSPEPVQAIPLSQRFRRLDGAHTG